MQEERTQDSCPKALAIFIVFLCLRPCALSDCCSVRPAQKHSPPTVGANPSVRFATPHGAEDEEWIHQWSIGGHYDT